MHHHSVNLRFIVGRTIARSAVDRQHAISGVDLHGNGKNILHLALKRCLAGFSWKNPVDQGQVREVQRILGKPAIQR
jgi:hypothetical protein